MVTGPRQRIIRERNKNPVRSLTARADGCFNAKTKAYILGIRGYEFNEFGERLYTNLYAQGLVGRAEPDASRSDGEREYYYLKDV